MEDPYRASFGLLLRGGSRGRFRPRSAAVLPPGRTGRFQRCAPLWGSAAGLLLRRLRGERVDCIRFFPNCQAVAGCPMGRSAGRAVSFNILPAGRLRCRLALTAKPYAALCAALRKLCRGSAPAPRHLVRRNSTAPFPAEAENSASVPFLHLRPKSRPAGGWPPKRACGRSPLPTGPAAAGLRRGPRQGGRKL